MIRAEDAPAQIAQAAWFCLPGRSDPTSPEVSGWPPAGTNAELVPEKNSQDAELFLSVA